MVASPKNRGGNVPFTSDAPVFMTAPQEVSLWRGKELDEYETGQMRTRITYLRLSYTFSESERKEMKPCGRCGAHLYLEGRMHNEVDRVENSAPGSSSSSSHSLGPICGKKRTAAEMIHELTALKDLKEAGVIDSPEVRRLKAKLFEDS